MTEKRFTFHHDVDGVDYIEDESIGFCLICDELLCSLLNELHEENKELKEELRIYRQVANCHNCIYHDYDWFDDGDEFEVCRKGNDVSEGICKDWEEL